MHRKTDAEENDEQKRRNIRKRKRMLKSIKVVSLIILTLTISVVPGAVIGLKGVSSQSELLALILSACSNSAANPIIYCTQIEELYKEIKKNVTYADLILLIHTVLVFHNKCVSLKSFESICIFLEMAAFSSLMAILHLKSIIINLKHDV